LLQQVINRTPPDCVSLLPETFSVLIAPVERLASALNSHLELQHYKILFISGNYSRILSRLDRKITELDVRRAFTVFQLMTILEENHHSFLIIEHDPLLLEDAEEMVEEVERKTDLLEVHLYSPALEFHLQTMTELAGRCSISTASRREATRRQDEDAGIAGYIGGILMRWPWKRRAELCEPRLAGRRSSVPGLARLRK
jgi:hypothetical protein